MNTKQQMITPTSYADINEILQELLTNTQAILGANFVGMYLDGSLASGDFDYATSDIDFVVATKTAVSPTQFDKLVAMHNRVGKQDSKWAIELEGAYIPLNALRRHNPANNIHPYIDRGASNLRWEPLDVDWIIHRYVLHNAGITLIGPPIQTLVEPVGKAELRQAVRDLLDIWWVPMIVNDRKLQHNGYRCYAIMTMCRMLYTTQIGDITSKPKAAQWVLATQDTPWQPLVQTALRWNGGTLEASIDEVQKFIEFTHTHGSTQRTKERVMSIKIETIIYRGFRGDTDFQRMVDIIEGSKEADNNEWTTSVEETANDYKHLHNCDPYTDMVFAEVNGETVGYGRCWWHDQLDGIRLYNFFAHLLPQWRGQGIRREMLHKLETRLRQIASEQPAEPEKFLQAWGSDTETHWTTLLEDEGYQIVRYGLEMVRPDLENIPDCPIPDGLEIRGGTQAEWPQIWYAAREAFRDHWGATEWTEDQLEQRQEHPTFNPPLWRVAWAGDEVAGGVLNFIDVQENEEYGRKRGYTETIFVRRPWRGQGLAQALIARSFAVLKEAGMEEAALGLDADNISGALHLYRKMGFEESKRFMTYRKPL